VTTLTIRIALIGMTITVASCQAWFQRVTQNGSAVGANGALAW
jgi:hypothetical protein